MKNKRKHLVMQQHPPLKIFHPEVRLFQRIQATAPRSIDNGPFAIYSKERKTKPSLVVLDVSDKFNIFTLSVIRH